MSAVKSSTLTSLLEAKPAAGLKRNSPRTDTSDVNDLVIKHGGEVTAQWLASYLESLPSSNRRVVQLLLEILQNPESESQANNARAALREALVVRIAEQVKRKFRPDAA